MMRFIFGRKTEKMNTIKEESLKELKEENNIPRRRDKSQTYISNEFNNLKSKSKEENESIFLDRVDEKFKTKKNIFNNKRIDQLFIKKIRESIKIVPIFNLLGLREKNKKNYDNISYEFKKYEQKFGINLSYKNRVSLKDEPPENMNNILSILSLPTEKRNFNDVLTIKKYLLQTKIEWLFRDEFENKEESIEKLLTFFGLEMNYRLFKEGEEVFKVGDSSVYLYLIIKGKIEILKPTPEMSLISGHEYFLYIMNLKHQKEDHLLNINLEENFRQFDIDKNEINLLPSIYIHHVFELIKMKKRIKFEDELGKVYMSLKDLDLTPETELTYEILSKKIEEKLPFIPPILLRKYKFIVDKVNKKKVKLTKYTKVLTLGNNEFFGESAMGENEKRNATIRVLEDSYLGYLSANLYKTNFFAEKKLAMQNKIHFLNTKFFFKNITLKRFSKKYFNLFIYEKYSQGSTLFEENEELKYVYFIEEGLVELTSNKTMLEIEIFLKGLEEKFLLNDDINNLKYNELKSRTKDLEDYLNKTQKSKILIVGRNESLGIESFFYVIPYFTKATVISQRAKIFKISIEQLWQILNIEIECISSLKNLVLNKIKILQRRLFSMNNTKLILLDNKIIFDYEVDFNNNFGNKSQIENETESKNNLLIKDIKTINISLLKKNKFFPLTPNNINGTNQRKKKNIHFYQKQMFDDVKNRNKNNLLIKNMTSFSIDDKIKYIKRKMKGLKIPSFEDRWLNNAKNEIKILNNDKQFISLYKFYNNKENNTKVEMEEENKVNNIKAKNNEKESNIINIENKKNKSLIISSRKDINSFNDFKNQKINKLNNSLDSILLPLLTNRKQLEKDNKNLFNNKKNIKNNISYSGNIEKDISKTYLKSINKSKSLFNIFKSNRYKDNSKKSTKFIFKKSKNFYEIKNDFEKKKFNFYNDKKIFSFNKEKKNNIIEIINFKEIKNRNNDSLYLRLSNDLIKTKNEETSTKINEISNFEGDLENNFCLSNH